jgi:hypothetical protein
LEYITFTGFGFRDLHVREEALYISLSLVLGLGTYMSGKRLCINKEYLCHLILTFCYLPSVVGGFFYK